MTAFIESQREFDCYLRQALGLSEARQNPHGILPGQGLPFLATHWAAMMMGPFARAFLAAGTDPPGSQPAPGRGDEPSDLRKTVEELKQQVDALREELKNDQDGRATGRLSGVDHDHDHDHEYMVPDMVPDMVPGMAPDMVRDMLPGSLVTGNQEDPARQKS